MTRFELEDLQQAARDGNAAEIEVIVCASPHLLNQRCGKGWTALIVAAFHGAHESIRRLLALGADPNQANLRGTTPLMYAKGHFLRTGDSHPMRLLLTAGARKDAKDAFGLTLLEYVPTESRDRVATILDAPSDGQEI